jgi:hypothetical protein
MGNLVVDLLGAPAGAISIFSTKPVAEIAN